MNIIKKLLLIGMGIIGFVFFGCNNGMNSKQDGNQENLGGITLDYNTSIYNVSMKDALSCSKDFVNKSVKTQNSREAFVNLQKKICGRALLITITGTFLPAFMEQVLKPLKMNL